MMALRMDIPICDRDCTNVPHADEIEGAMIVCFERSSVPPKLPLYPFTF
jgi:hypothetical protein